MKIKKTLSKLVSFDDRESKYIYRIIENTVKIDKLLELRLKDKI